MPLPDDTSPLYKRKCNEDSMGFLCSGIRFAAASCACRGFADGYNLRCDPASVSQRRSRWKAVGRAWRIRRLPGRDDCAAQKDGNGCERLPALLRQAGCSSVERSPVSFCTPLAHCTPSCEHRTVDLPAFCPQCSARARGPFSLRRLPWQNAVFCSLTMKLVFCSP